MSRCTFYNYVPAFKFFDNQTNLLFFGEKEGSLIARPDKFDSSQFSKFYKTCKTYTCKSY